MAVRIAVLLLALLLFSPSQATAAEIRVPADQPTIQDGVDLSIIGAAFGAGEGDPRYNSSADFDRSGVIDGDDQVIFSFYFGTTV